MKTRTRQELFDLAWNEAEAVQDFINNYQADHDERLA